MRAEIGGADRPTELLFLEDIKVCILVHLLLFLFKEHMLKVLKAKTSLKHLVKRSFFLNSDSKKRNKNMEDKNTRKLQSSTNYLSGLL